MIKRLIAATALATMLVAPISAQDAEAPVASEVAVPEAMPAKRGPLQYAKVDYNLNEDRENIWLLDLSNGQRVAIRLMPDWAPEHVQRIKTLTRQGFYDGIIFHRVIEGFMAQSGDPTGTGQGGSSFPDLKAEFNPMPHVRGTVSMARAQSDDSANSQFFIVFYPRFNLDKKYTNFGRVIGNMAAVDAITRGEPPTSPTRIVQASLASDNKPVPVFTPALTERAISVDDLNAPIGN